MATIVNKQITIFKPQSLHEDATYNYTRYSVSYNKNLKSFYLYVGSSNHDGTKFAFDANNCNLQLVQVARYSDKTLKTLGSWLDTNIDALHKVYLTTGAKGLREAIRDLSYKTA